MWVVCDCLWTKGVQSSVPQKAVSLQWAPKIIVKSTARLQTQTTVRSINCPCTHTTLTIHGNKMQTLVMYLKDTWQHMEKEAELSDCISIHCKVTTIVGQTSEPVNFF